jgi:hypothetical protein
MKRTLLLALVAVAVLGVAGCSEDEEKPTGVDPNTPFPYAEPAVATMQVDVEDLGEGGYALGPAGICHALTTLVVAWVNLNVEVRLLIPEAALVACLQQPPVYLGNSTWRWTANGGQGAGAWTAELTGTLASATQVEWVMRVTGTQLNLNRFLWFDGRCDLAAQAGDWVFYDPASPATPKAVIQCAWSLPAATEADRTLDFENVDTTAPEYHDLLHYALADSIALISFTDASAQSTTEARWDLRDGSGRAISAQGDTCCWGARPLFPDIACP